MVLRTTLFGIALIGNQQLEMATNTVLNSNMTSSPTPVSRSYIHIHGDDDNKYENSTSDRISTQISTFPVVTQVEVQAQAQIYIFL